jgi:hypothetical protein
MMRPSLLTMMSGRLGTTLQISPEGMGANLIF